jgi:hypothetical protein
VRIVNKNIKLALVFSAAIFLLLAVNINQHLRSFALVQYDDSYITYRYSQSLVTGNGLRFNLEDLSNSASSLSFALLLSTISYLTTSSNFPMISTLTNAAMVFVALTTINYYALRVSKNKVTGLLVGALSSACLVSSGYFQYWSVSGMETGFFIGLAIVLTVFLGINTNFGIKSSQILVTYLLLVVLTLTRVEGAIISFAISSLLMFTDRASGRLTLRINKWGLIAQTIVVTTFLGQMVFNKLYYGQVLSDPIIFKQLVQYYSRSQSEQFFLELFFLKTIIGAQVSILIVLFIGLLILFYKFGNKRLLSFIELAPAILFVTLFGYLVQVPFSDEYRYQLILLIPATVGILFYGVKFGNFVSNLNFERSIQLIFITFTISVIGTSHVQIESVTNSTSGLWYVQQARIDAGKWLEKNSEPGSWILAGDIGAISYFNPSNNFIDSAGLVNRDLLRVVSTGGNYGSEIVSREPDFVADTTGLAGQTASEYIFDNVESYYAPWKTNVFNSCKFENTFLKELQISFPKEVEKIPYISVYSVKLLNCR